MGYTLEKFKKFEEISSVAMDLMRKNAFPSSEKRTLKTWNLTDAATLVGRTINTIKEHEKKNLISKPQLIEKGKRFYSLKEINELREHFQTLPVKKRNIPAIIAISNFKGGVAKTTTAIHGAHYFALSGYKVLLVDIDSQGTATSCFGYSPDDHIKTNQTLLPFFIGENDDLSSLIIPTHWDRLDLIPANLGLYNVELELPVMKDRAISHNEDFNLYDILDNGLKQVYDKYDVIIIDCPPSMSILNTNALYAASSLLIPCPPELPDVASMFQFLSMVKGVLEKLPNKEYEFLRILLTKHDGNKTSHNIAAVLRRIFGSHIMRSEMLNTQVIKSARAEMKSIYEVSKYKGSQQTLRRALQIVDDIYKEIEEYINESRNNSLDENISMSKKVEIV